LTGLLPCYGVGMGVAMMMQQATSLTGSSVVLDAQALENHIRRAKAEGRTVTIVNGNLYIDYNFFAQIPPYFDMKVC
uniref:DNA polymerase n=1 Tax=Dracunculus medinensis TaxID=318479 RepID=A0A0N4UIN7_DRAME